MAQSIAMVGYMRFIAIALALLLTTVNAQAAHKHRTYRAAAVTPPWYVPHGPNTETRWHQATRTVPIWLKLNPIWWFMNDDQQRVDQAPWYEPTWPEWERILVWNCCRNPLQNFRSYVLGVQDRNFYVTWDKPFGTIQRNDLCNRDNTGKIINCQTGYIRGTLWGGDLWFPLPFVSYSGKNVVWYYGWQPGGFAGFKFNLHNSSCGDPNNYSATC